MFTAGLLRNDYQGVYVTADCSVKDRNERKRMVVELEKKIEAKPEQYHFIKGENILSLGYIKNYQLFGLKLDAIDLGETSSGNPKFLKLDRNLVNFLTF